MAVNTRMRLISRLNKHLSCIESKSYPTTANAKPNIKQSTDLKFKIGNLQNIFKTFNYVHEPWINGEKTLNKITKEQRKKIK